MAVSLVYVVATPSPNRNCEMDRAAAALGPDSVHLIFMKPQWKSASWQPTFPRVCPYHCVDSSPEYNGLPLARLSAKLDELNPRVVVVGGFNQAVARRTIAWCRARGVAYCLRSDSNVWTDRYKGWSKYLVRRLLLAPKVRRASGVLLTGEFNRQFWLRYGLRPEQAQWWPQWIDYDRFLAARALRAQQRDVLAARYGLSRPVNVLYVGRLIALKHLDVVAEAMLGVPDEVGLVLVGRGPEEARLRERFGSRLGGRLHFVGQVEPEQIADLYAVGDLLVLPTGPRENWGLVLNEAGAAGLPIICHRHVGAAADLLVDRQNGIALASDDAAAWRSALREATADRGRLAEWGRASAAISDAWRRRSVPEECLAALLTRFGGA